MITRSDWHGNDQNQQVMIPTRAANLCHRFVVSNLEREVKPPTSLKWKRTGNKAPTAGGRQQDARQRAERLTSSYFFHYNRTKPSRRAGTAWAESVGGGDDSRSPEIEEASSRPRPCGLRTLRRMCFRLRPAPRDSGSEGKSSGDQTLAPIGQKLKRKLFRLVCQTMRQTRSSGVFYHRFILNRILDRVMRFRLPSSFTTMDSLSTWITRSG